MTSVVYDAGALVAADRNDRALWAQHRVLLERGALPVVPAPVLAQVSRTSRQVQLRRLLRGCEVAPLDERDAHATGMLLAVSATSDVVDAFVVIAALARGAAIVTSDRKDLGRLLDAAGADLDLLDV